MSTNKNKRMRVGFLCSGNGALFRKTAEACETGMLDSEIVVCIADRPCKSVEIANDYGIESYISVRANFKNREMFSDDILRKLQQKNADLVVLTFDSLISGRILEDYRGKIINIHFSLLPAFTGFHATEKAIEKGVKFGGVTLHLVDQTTDGGPIISQAILPIKPDLTVVNYQQKLFERGYRMMIQLLKWYEQQRVSYSPGDKPSICGAEYGGYPYNPALEIFTAEEE